jgi:predicted P-loop ATPase
VLNDPTGERRYWPVAVKQYDQDAFRRDKDQLYAEAVAAEPTEELWLDPEMDAAQRLVAAEAKAPNDWVDSLMDLRGMPYGTEERISVSDVREHLGLNTTDAVKNGRMAGQMNDAMTYLGWERASMRIGLGDDPVKGFRRPLSAAKAKAEAKLSAAHAKYFVAWGEDAVDPEPAVSAVQPGPRDLFKS